MFLRNLIMNAIANSSPTSSEEFETILDEADAVLIGAGAGLSASAGLLYTDLETFRAWFPGYHERYGLTYIYEAAFHPFETQEELFGYWARHILTIRHRYPAGQPYLDLFQLLGHRKHFVFTTNVDGQFAKAGFDPERICSPQGDYAFFQCSRPCSDTLYPNKELVEEMVASMREDEFAIPSALVPHCPTCGAVMEANVHKNSNFVSAPWHRQYEALQQFLKQHSAGKIVLLELGVGFSTAGIIRRPFDRIVASTPNVTLIRVNLDAPSTPIPATASRSIGIKCDAGGWISDLLANENSK
jgi:NAD-dependent SIR2 family protein deacetylase